MRSAAQPRRRDTIGCRQPASVPTVLTGASAGVSHASVLAATAGAYALSGTAAALVHAGNGIIAGVGGYSLSGIPAALVQQRVLDAGAGSYSLTGSAVSLVLQPVTVIVPSSGGISRPPPRPHLPPKPVEIVATVSSGQGDQSARLEGSLSACRPARGRAPSAAVERRYWRTSLLRRRHCGLMDSNRRQHQQICAS
jgi:hypothetical protein